MYCHDAQAHSELHRHLEIKKYLRIKNPNTHGLSLKHISK